MRRVSSAGVAAGCLWVVPNLFLWCTACGALGTPLFCLHPGPGFETRSWGPACLPAAVTQGAQLHTCVLPRCIAHVALMADQCFMLFTTASGCATAQFCDIFVHVLQPHYLAVRAAVATWRVLPQGHLLLFDWNRPSWLCAGMAAGVWFISSCGAYGCLHACQYVLLGGVLLLCSSAGLLL